MTGQWRDVATKRDAAAVLTSVGLTVSDAVRLVLIRTAREGVLAFNPFGSNETAVAAMWDACDEQLLRFNSIEALTADLNSSD